MSNLEKLNEELMDDLESEETLVEIETKEDQTSIGTTTVRRIEMTGEEEIGTGEIGITTDVDRSRITTMTEEDGKCTWE